MKIKKRMGICLLAAALTVSGCGAGKAELSEENRGLVAEYAAGLLLKYSQGYEQTLTDIPRVKEEKKPEAPQETTDAQGAGENGGSGDGEDASVSVSVEEVLGLDPGAVQITFSGYQVCASYPDQETEEEEFFAMDASQGRELYVFRFVVSNVSGAEQNCDILDSNAKFRFRFDKKGQENALTTMLLNDLQTVKEVIEPGGQREVVLVLERDQGLADSFDSVELLVKNGKETAVMQLQ